MNIRREWRRMALLTALTVTGVIGVSDGADTSSALVGHWIHLSGTVEHIREAPKVLELFKDGTGTLDKGAITWKVENKSLYSAEEWRCFRCFNIPNNAKKKRLVFLRERDTLYCVYMVSGYELTLVYETGEHAIFVKEDKIGEVRAKAEAEGVKHIEQLTRQFVFVAGGTFTMGCTAEQSGECRDDEKPAHSVTVGDFSIGKYEVTQKQWKAVMGDKPSCFQEDDNRPVEGVSLNDVRRFIEKLNAITGKKYRLPTEAEWEYAARGGSKSRGYKYSGSDKLRDVAWYNVNSGIQVLTESFFEEAIAQDDDSQTYNEAIRSNRNTTRPVGTKKPNELGIYDMSGNVSELVSDEYGEYSSTAQTNPAGPARGSSRFAYRGGSWYDSAWSCRVSCRDIGTLDFRSYLLGFRLALSPR
jgi:formylglycine-generating enzyme required for sulfatase activity